MVHDIRRLLEAASALSTLLRTAGVPHAFHGGFVVALLSNAPQCDEIFCIVEGGTSHPFKRVRQACASSEDITTRSSPWTNRMHATYHRLIPPIDASTTPHCSREFEFHTFHKHQIEVLPAGEEGPRRLDSGTVMTVAGLPVLTMSEFIRAKLKAWVIRRLDHDAEDIVYALSRYWNRVDINRIPEQDMCEFVARFRAAEPAWKELKKKYRVRV